jgi:Kef-type K+ transport system membrane component KefB
MAIPDFFPTFPVALNLLTATGLILIAGLLGARLVTRLASVPAIIGYVLAGFLIGPGALNFINVSDLNDLGLLVDFALGMVVFELGRRLDYKWLLHEKWLLISGVLISASIFFGLFSLLTAFGVSKLIAGMAAAFGMATSPAVTLNIVRETKAEGQVSERMLNIVAIGNSLAFIVFTVCLSALHVEYRTDWTTFVLHPLYLVVGSIALGWIGGRLLIYFSQWLGRDSEKQRIALFALIAGTIGIAVMFKLSTLIALLALGIASRNYDREHAIVEPDFGQFSSLFYVVLFVFAGANLELFHLREYWLIVLLFIGARLAISIFLSTALSSFNGLTVRKGALLGLGLVPMSGVAIILMQRSAAVYPEFGAQLSALMVSVLAILEILGPICTRYALVKSGEAKV